MRQIQSSIVKITGKGKASTTSPNAADDFGAENRQSENSGGQGSALLVESESDDVSEQKDVEDDEFGSLLTMVNTYANRQQQSVSEDSGSEPSALVQVLYQEEDEDQEEGGEEEVLAAMLKCHQLRVDTDNGEDYENPPLSIASSSVTVDKVNRGGGGLCKKKKSKAQLRNEKQQAASLNRHTKFAEELLREKEVGIGKADTSSVVENDHCDVMMKGLHEEIGILAKEGTTISKDEKVEKRQSRESLSMKGKIMNGPSMVEDQQPKRTARGKKGKGISKNAVITCETCGEDFDSRNQLFKHISATKHAALRGK